jgi:hypothetical protein
LANFTFASHRHLPIRKANRDSADGALGLSLPKSLLISFIGMASPATAVDRRVGPISSNAVAFTDMT